MCPEQNRAPRRTAQNAEPSHGGRVGLPARMKGRERRCGVVSLHRDRCFPSWEACPEPSRRGCRVSGGVGHRPLTRCRLARLGDKHEDRPQAARRLLRSRESGPLGTNPPRPFGPPLPRGDRMRGPHAKRSGLTPTHSVAPSWRHTSGRGCSRPGRAETCRDDARSPGR